MRNFIVSAEDVGKSLAEFLKSKGISRKTIIALKKTPDGLMINGAHAKSISILKSDDVISITLPSDTTEIDPNAELNVPIIYKDDFIIVFNKPSGMPCHPSIKHRTDTLANYFSYLYPEKTFRCLNRLDRDTSGLSLCAKDSVTANHLSGKISKVYYAIASGIIAEAGTINAPIARERESIITRCVREDGQQAITHYKPIKSTSTHTLLEIHLETGRTHQIRVHLSHIGHSLAGDSLYGSDTSLSRQALHCGKIEFIHPITNESISLESDLPSDMLAILQ